MGCGDGEKKTREGIGVGERGIGAEEKDMRLIWEND